MSEFIANIRVCRTCGCPIPADRLRTLPQAEYCINHSTEQKRTDVKPDGPDLDDLRDSVQHGRSEQ